MKIRMRCRCKGKVYVLSCSNSKFVTIQQTSMYTETSILHTKAYYIVHTNIHVAHKIIFHSTYSIHFAHKIIFHGTYKHSCCTPKYTIKGELSSEIFQDTSER